MVNSKEHIPFRQNRMECKRHHFYNMHASYRHLDRLAQKHKTLYPQTLSIWTIENLSPLYIPFLYTINRKILYLQMCFKPKIYLQIIVTLRHIRSSIYGILFGSPVWHCCMYIYTCMLMAYSVMYLKCLVGAWYISKNELRCRKRNQSIITSMKYQHGKGNLINFLSDFFDSRQYFRTPSGLQCSVIYQRVINVSLNLHAWDYA